MTMLEIFSAWIMVSGLIIMGVVTFCSASLCWEALKQAWHKHNELIVRQRLEDGSWLTMVDDEKETP